MKENVTIQQYIVYAYFFILALCGLIFSPLACTEIAIDIPEVEKPIVPTISGRDGNLNFVLNFNNYDEGDDISLRSVEDLKAETVVIPLGDDLSMYATLEPVTVGGVRTRSAELRSFAANTRLIIVAYKQSATPTIYNYEQHRGFRVDSVGLASTLTRDDLTPFSLSNDTYKFVAYSYNDNVTPLPVVDFHLTMDITDIDNNIDLIWGTSDDIPISAGSNDVLIKMTHKFSQARIDAMCKANVGNITEISEVKMLGYTADLDVEQGILTAGTDSTMSFSGFPAMPFSADSISSSYRIVYTAGTTPTIVTIGSLVVGGNPYNDLIATFSRALKPGYKYDIKIRFGDANYLNDDTPPTGFNPYIGAFWRHNQKGERLIRMERPTSSTAADGVWSATVVKGADWIVLDKSPSTDNNLWKLTDPDLSGNDPGFESTHYLSGNDIYVNGVMDASTPEIYFRIGLRNTLSDANAHRYGIVLLTYADNTKRQRIWIRQGETPDFLMNTTDVGSGIANRPDAVRFAAYNLKDPQENSITDYNGMVNTSTGLIGPRGGSFTDYPSQAGYHFAWNYSTRAFNPYSLTFANMYYYPNSHFGPAFWNPVTDETCPPGYRRPTDGFNNTIAHNTTGDVAGSEFRQSLWLNPSSDNFSNKDNAVAGYYADGFFDRRQLVPGPNSGGGPNPAVSTGNSGIAYQGVLFFNPSTNASIFFPFASFRLPSPSGGTINSGFEAVYMSSSSYNSYFAWIMHATHNAAVVGMANNVLAMSQRDVASSIRCVEEECFAVSSVTISPSLGDVTVGASVLLTATPVPGGANNLTYLWEFSVDGGSSWHIADGETGATYNAPAMIAGITQYRVTASNHCSTTPGSNVVEISGSGAELPPPLGLNLYAGAFWRWNQTGERLIRIARPNPAKYTDPVDPAVADGAWTAIVIEGDSWIRLDRNPSPDNGVWTSGGPNISGNNGGFEGGTYNVGGSATMVTGTLRPTTDPNYQANDEYIYFRIGLTGNLSNTTDHRYGVVLLVFGDHTMSQRIFIRQGDAPDFLMRPNDGIRPNAGVFSAFNLTTSGGWNSSMTGVQLTVNGAPSSGGMYQGVFTEYPSQAGAFFEWANPGTRTRYAWVGDANHLTGTTLSSPGWASLSPGSYWTAPTNLSITHETCPVDYRRPEDGPTNAASAGAITGSEVRQSLWLNPPNGQDGFNPPLLSNISNSVWGYYADGFFDRREIVDAASTNNSHRTLSSVSATTTDIAHIGRLFYNPNTNASLFFPAQGNRNSSGQLGSMGVTGYYWTSSSESTNNAWYVRLSDDKWNLHSTSMHTMGTNGAVGIRCVYDPCFAVTGVTLAASPSGTQPIGSSITYTATVSPSIANKVHYVWEHQSSGGTWEVISGASGSTLHMAVIAGSNSFRVTAINGCGSALSNVVTITGSGYMPDDKGELPSGQVFAYVGAFWKANETGERVIRINMGDNPSTQAGNWGPWSATVAFYDPRWSPASGDGIVFAAGPSGDAGITYNTSTQSPGNAETYNLAYYGSSLSPSSIVMGEVDPTYGGYIEFRMFPQQSFTSTGKFQADVPGGSASLDANYSTTWPARYAVVQLTYGVAPIKTMRLYLRQGEGSDYVMYDQAINVGASSNDPGFVHPAGTKRPYTMRIPPYNLTDPMGRATADWNSVTQLNATVSGGGGSFVSYPSQAGYHFQYSTSTKAFHPSDPITISNWNSSFTAWTSPPWIPANSETCPVGYRRIKDFDGGANGNYSDIATSEVRQSFYLNPSAGQSTQDSPVGLTWGYYADGYFDRREIVIQNTQLGAQQPSAVSWGTPQSAYIGAILYNPNTYSNLFIPLSGIRETSLNSGILSNGEIGRVGVWGYYLTSSWSDFGLGTAGQYSKSFRIQGNWTSNTSSIAVENSFRARGFSIRCVRERVVF